MGTVRFIHAADIHLDSPLAGLARRAGTASLADCTRRAFSAMVDLAISEDVDFVVIAGDLYDADWKDYSTGLFAARELQRLAPRPCFVVHGNHDAKSVITRQLTMPPNVTVFPAHRPATVPVPGLDVVLHGQSFPDRAVPNDLAAKYPAPVEGAFNIGILHTSAEDPGEHETYAPCSLSTLRLKGYDYWALGHIHARRILATDPWIVFSGNLQGRHSKETGEKGCTLVEVEDRPVVRVEHRPVDVLRWANVTVDATGANELFALTGRVEAALSESAATAEGRTSLVRVTLRGATPLHAFFLADPDAIEAECQAAAINTGADITIESVRLLTSQPLRAAGEDALSQLRESFLAALDDHTVSAALLRDMQDLVARLPSAARSQELAVPDSVEELRNLAPDAWELVANLFATSEPA